MLVERANGAETQLFAKEVRHAGRRYIVCRNEAEAEKDRADRQAIIAGLEQQLRRGDKALIGNSAYRRYLRRVARRRKGGKGKPGPAFEIDAGKLAEEARYDGIFVLRTNARVTPLQAMLRYRELLAVETLFRKTKSVLRTRPIYHSSDAAIRGHVFCSFLALVLQKELDERCRAAGFTAGMGRRAARPRSAAAGRGEPGRQDLEGAHRRRGDRLGAAAGLRHRHPAADPGHPAAGPGPGQPTPCTEAPGPPPAWCHAPLISPFLRAKSATCKFEVLKLGTACLSASSARRSRSAASPAPCRS